MKINLIKMFLPFALCLLPFAFFLYLRHREKAKKKKLDLIGKVAIVQTELSPRGAILANGELWLAETVNHNEKILVGSKVRIIKTNGHLLAVDSNVFD